MYRAAVALAFTCTAACAHTDRMDAARQAAAVLAKAPAPILDLP